MLVKPLSFRILQLIVSQLRRLFQISSLECEKFNGETIMQSEEKIKKSQSFIYKLVTLCTKLINRHDHSSDPEKVKKYMRYQTLQQVNILLLLFLKRFYTLQYEH